jgi:preprotein translocase subunit SecD
VAILLEARTVVRDRQGQRLSGTSRAAFIALCAAWTIWLVSPLSGFSQAPAAATLEVRLAEAAPAPGLVEMTVQDSNEKVYLHREAVVTSADVVQATVVPGITSVNFNVAVTFNSAGAARMARATASHLNKPVAILINGRLVAAPKVRAQISDQAVISGDFDRTQADAIARALNRQTR